MGAVTVELLAGTDSRKLLDDVKARVDAIDTFPEETEKPIIRELTNRRQVIDVAVAGEADEASLRNIADRVRDGLAALPGYNKIHLAWDDPSGLDANYSGVEVRWVAFRAAISLAFKVL